MAALDQANRDSRVLIVVHQWKRPPFGQRPWWMNDTMWAWLKWHGLMVECKDQDPQNREYLRRYPPDDTTLAFGFDIIINKARRHPMVPLPLDLPIARGPDDQGESNNIGVGATLVLFQVNLQYEEAMANSLIWAASHELSCPEPKRPHRSYLYSQDSDDIPATPDTPKPRQGERYVDVLASVREADSLTAAGERAKAFSLLTWAWERGSELDPAFALARVGLILPRMTVLRNAQPALTKRMKQIGEAEFALYPWFDAPEELAYLCLRYQAGEKDQVVSRTIVENIDPDEQTMAGLIPARLAGMNVRITELTSDSVISPADWKDFMGTVRLKVPSSAEKDIKDLWRRSRVELAATAAVRTYASLLASGTPTDHARAETLAQDVIKEAANAPAPVRAAVLRTLVMAAASVGKADSGHAAWLHEAAKIDPPAKGKDKAAGDPLSRFVPALAK